MLTISLKKALEVVRLTKSRQKKMFQIKKLILRIKNITLNNLGSQVAKVTLHLASSPNLRKQRRRMIPRGKMLKII